MKDSTAKKRKSHCHKWVDVTHRLHGTEISTQTKIDAFDDNYNGPRIKVWGIESVKTCKCGAILCKGDGL